MTGILTEEGLTGGMVMPCDVIERPEAGGMDLQVIGMPRVSSNYQKPEEQVEVPPGRLQGNMVYQDLEFWTSSL